jgi:hypothetical protein
MTTALCTAAQAHMQKEHTSTCLNQHHAASYAVLERLASYSSKMEQQSA